jgi:hypothetical protein
MTVTIADNSSNPIALVTDTKGGVEESLAAGRYVLRLSDESLSIKIPLQITTGNLTKVQVTILGTAYPVQYSEVQGLVLFGSKPQSNMFVEVPPISPTVNPGEKVILKVHTGPAGFLSNATVLADQPPVQGLQWLQLGASTPINAAGTTSIFLTTWTYSDSISVQVNPFVVSADA